MLVVGVAPQDARHGDLNAGRRTRHRSQFSDTMPIDSARVSKADGSQSLEVPAEQGAVLTRAAEEFEQRVFLSTLNDIRNFCEAYGIEDVLRTGPVRPRRRRHPR